MIFCLRKWRKKENTYHIIDNTGIAKIDINWCNEPLNLLLEKKLSQFFAWLKNRKRKIEAKEQQKTSDFFCSKKSRMILTKKSLSSSSWQVKFLRCKRLLTKLERFILCFRIFRGFFVIFGFCLKNLYKIVSINRDILWRNS